MEDERYTVQYIDRDKDGIAVEFAIADGLCHEEATQCAEDYHTRTGQAAYLMPDWEWFGVDSPWD